MADNQLTVVSADGQTRATRSLDLSGSHLQAVIVGEGLREVPAVTTGATIVYTVTNGAAVGLVAPTAGAMYCRLRAHDTAYDPNDPVTQNQRLFYRQDNTAPTANGANAVGYLLHGESMLVRLADFTRYKMIAETTNSHTWTVYAEWLNIPAS